MTRVQMIVSIMNQFFDLKEEARSKQRELERIWNKQRELEQWLKDEGIEFDKNGNPTLEYMPKEKKDERTDKHS